MEKERKFKKATQVQVYRVGCLINENCSAVDGFAVYADGWSDQAIADEVDVSLSTVSSMRSDMVGKFPPVIKKVYSLDDIPPIVAANEALTARVGELETAVLGLAERLPEGSDADFREVEETEIVVETAEKKPSTPDRKSSKGDPSQKEASPIDNSDERGDDIPPEDPEEIVAEPGDPETVAANENSAVQDFAKEVSASANTDDFDYGDEEDLKDE